MGVEQLPRIRGPGEGTGPRERMERAEAEVCPTNSFPALTLRPGLETRETRGTRRAKRVEELRYMHRNPVRRGLVEAPEQWPWSSFRAYAHQERGLVRVNEWSVLKLKF